MSDRLDGRTVGQGEARSQYLKSHEAAKDQRVASIEPLRFES